MLRALFGLASPRGRGARLSVLIFHRVTPEPSAVFPLDVDARRFDALCSWVRRWFSVLPLDVALTQMKAGCLPSRAMAITFDDGYEDNHSVALPILQRHGLAATFFIATSFLDGGRMWNDTIIESVIRTRKQSLALPAPLGDGRESCDVSTTTAKRLTIEHILPLAKYLPAEERQHWCERFAALAEVDPPRDLMLRSEQVRDLSRRGMQIGAHTVSHPILAKLDDAASFSEMTNSKRHLEGILGARVSLFAYPNGKPGEDYDERHVRMARDCGFSAAMSTAHGVASVRTDPFQVPRFTPWDRSRVRFAVRLAGNLLAPTRPQLPHFVAKSPM